MHEHNHRLLITHDLNRPIHKDHLLHPLQMVFYLKFVLILVIYPESDNLLLKKHVQLIRHYLVVVHLINAGYQSLDVVMKLQETVH